MKKKILLTILVFFTFWMVSCSEHVQVRFDIADDIQVELEDYSEYYSFSSSITVYCNEEKVDYPELSIGLCEGETVKLGNAQFYVSYVFNKKEYKETFIVTFVDHRSNVTIHLFNEVTSLQYENGSSLETLKLITVPNGFSLEGFYYDSEYTQPLNLSEAITKDIEVYAKLTYSHTFVWYPANVDAVVYDLNGYISSMMSQTTDYIPAWNQEGFKGRWNYIDGVFLNSIVNLYYETSNTRYKNFFINYINYYIDSSGHFINPQTYENTGYRSGELDSVCESRILFDAYQMTKDERYLKAIEYTYQELSKMSLAQGTSNYSHKETYKNQIWLDGMYMYVPFLARYAKEKNDSSIFATIKTQYEYIRNHMFDEDKKLYYHGHDTTKSIFWADSETGNSKSFWLRSNGWFIVSLVDALEYFPEGVEKEYLKEILVEAIEGILQYKDKDTNLFYQLVDQGRTAFVVPYEYFKNLKNNAYSKDSVVKNYLESSGSSMIAYSLMKSARLGYISSNYQEVGKNIFEGIYEYSYKNGSLENICITAGLGPETSPFRDGTAQYYLAEPVGKDDAKGVGPFLMAYLEYASMNQKLEKYYTLSIHTIQSDFNLSVKKDSLLNQVFSPELPNYVFEGFYFDEEFRNKVPENYQITKNEDIYLKHLTFYEHLKSSNSIYMSEDFNSYTNSDSLPKFEEWGTKGIYEHINDKDPAGVDKSLNYIELGNGDAYLHDTSEIDGTQLIIDTGGLSKGIVKGYLEVLPYNTGNQWTFFQMYGQRDTGIFGEIFGARFDNGILNFRINGGEIYPAYDLIYPEDITYKIEYIYDLDHKFLSVKMNGAYVIQNYYMMSAVTFGGIKIVSSDKLVHKGDGTLVHRTARIDNIIIVVEK